MRKTLRQILHVSTAALTDAEMIAALDRDVSGRKYGDKGTGRNVEWEPAE